jgi:TetR/AcrR family transcriptional repressor of nem operon
MRNARDKLLESAVRLLGDYGYSATTVDDICEDAGVAKGSFYHFFGSKEALAVAALDHFVERNSAILMSGDFTRETDPGKRLFGFLEHVARSADVLWNHGCLMGSFTSDLVAVSPDVQKKVSGILAAIRDEIAQLFEGIADRGEVGAKDLADHYIAAIEGGIILARAHDEPRYITEAVKQLTNYFSLLASA